MRLVRRTWHGDELLVRAKRAEARAVIGMGEHRANAMRGAAHRDSGDLARSCHAAKVNTMGTVPAEPGTVREGPSNVQVEAGSWLPYACVENNRGGAHRFAEIGNGVAQAADMEKLHRAFREEGL